MGLDQYFYATNKKLVNEIIKAYDVGFGLTTEFVLDHLFGYKKEEYYDRKNWPLDTLLLDNCQRLINTRDSVYVVPREVIKDLSKVERFADMSEEESDRVAYAIKELASIYDGLDDETTMLYLRDY